MNYDGRCRELAEYFLAGEVFMYSNKTDAEREHITEHLSCEIQLRIEDYLDRKREEMDQEIEDAPRENTAGTL